MFDFFKKLLGIKKKKTPRPQVIKMYVLCRLDLEPIHRCVQGGHAVAEFFMRNTLDENRRTLINRDGYPVTWKNGHMIYLGVKDEHELAMYENILIKKYANFASFREPDWKDIPELTAIACISFGDEFRDLPLLNMDGINSDYNRDQIDR